MLPGSAKVLVSVTFFRIFFSTELESTKVDCVPLAVEAHFAPENVVSPLARLGRVPFTVGLSRIHSAVLSLLVQLMGAAHHFFYDKLNLPPTKKIQFKRHIEYIPPFFVNKTSVSKIRSFPFTMTHHLS